MEGIEKKTNGRTPKPNVTIITDASLDPKRKMAGWGGWARGDNRTSVSHGGRLQHHANTGVLELRALANMLWTLNQTGYLLLGDRVIMLQCDNLEALCALMRATPNTLHSKHVDGAEVRPQRRLVSGPMLEAVDVIREVAGDRQLVVRHVRGHKPGGGRQWVNRLCDKLARRGMIHG